MNRLGIERLSVFGMPPVEFVELVADLDCGWVGMGLAPSGRFNSHGYRDWSLRDDAALRRETRAALSHYRSFLDSLAKHIPLPIVTARLA
jgi:hypothetical protein